MTSNLILCVQRWVDETSALPIPERYREIVERLIPASDWNHAFRLICTTGGSYTRGGKFNDPKNDPVQSASQSDQLDSQELIRTLINDPQLEKTGRLNLILAKLR